MITVIEVRNIRCSDVVLVGDFLPRPCWLLPEHTGREADLPVDEINRFPHEDAASGAEQVVGIRRFDNHRIVIAPVKSRLELVGVASCSLVMAGIPMLAAAPRIKPERKSWRGVTKWVIVHHFCYIRLIEYLYSYSADSAIDRFDCQILAVGGCK